MDVSVLIIPFFKLLRLDRPVGILLLLWPTLWSLWLAAGGVPSVKNLVIFTAGCVLMRSAGCVINDYADRGVDRYVQRTKDRPVTSGAVKPRTALLLFFFLCLTAFVFVLQTNTLTVALSAGALSLVVVYPFCKRYTHLPQVVLGAAFAWSVPMAWAAEKGSLSPKIWLVYCAVVLWTIAYDTFYAMVDRDCDLKVGIRSTAILFGDADRVITAVLQLMTILTLILVGRQFDLGVTYYAGLLLASGLFVWQQYLIRNRVPADCFRAFLNNQWVGLLVFVGIAADYYVRSV